ncbi:unnamed protein product, partial [Brugia timori]
MSGPLSSSNSFFYLCGDWLEEINDRGLVLQMKNELNNFTSTIIFHPYYYYASDFFFDSSVITNEIKCLDLTYLMEQRFRYTHIRDDLELPHLASKLRRKCGNCLRKMKGDSEDEAKNDNAVQTETQVEGNNTSQMVETENRDGTQIETQTEPNNVTETVASGEDTVTGTETRMEYGRTSQTIASGE